MAKVYSLFISHSWTHADWYRRLRDLLGRKPFFLFKACSVAADDPVHDQAAAALLGVRIEEEMQSCDIVVILASGYDVYGKWIDREIDVARKRFAHPKPILAIRPEGDESVPAVLEEMSDRLVEWDPDSVVDAIHELADGG